MLGWKWNVRGSTGLAKLPLLDSGPVNNEIQTYRSEMRFVLRACLRDATLRKRDVMMKGDGGREFGPGGYCCADGEGGREKDGARRSYGLFIGDAGGCSTLALVGDDRY